MAANDLGPRMEAGTYYSLRNARMKVSGGGHLEGTISEVNKICKLDENSLENQPELQALLQ